MNNLLSLGVLLLLTLFFSWSLFLLVSSSKRKKLAQETPLFWLMVAPEILLTLLLILANRPETILGLVMGTNLVIFLLIPGLKAVFSRGSLKIKDRNLRWDFLAVFLITALPLILLHDFSLSAFEGGILLLVAGLFFARQRKRLILDRKIFSNQSVRRQAFFGGLLSLIFFLLSLLVVFSLSWPNLSWFVLGLLPLAFLVSLPEVLVNLQLVDKPVISFAGLLEPLVFNTTFILGISGLLSPFKLSSPAIYLRSVILFLIGFAIFYFFAWSKKKISRYEGMVLIIYYLLSLVVITI